MTTESIVFARVPAQEAEARGYLDECAALFSNHYGKWAPLHARAGHNITMSASRLKRYLPDGSAWVATARVREDLIGYAMVVQNGTPHGVASWVTQFVVHRDYRNQLVGSKILASIWGNSQHYAWGIASANPFAIRALEKVTRRRCQPAAILDRIASVKRIMAHIPYLANAPPEVTQSHSVVNTSFNQDLSEVQRMLAAASSKTPWIMGAISEGHEWLAVTFNSQPPRRWSDQEFRIFMNASDHIAHEAYERMSLTNQNHSWARPDYAEREISYLSSRLGLTSGMRVLDFGCGSGRHSIALAKSGISVFGVDFSKVAIAAARTAAVGLKSPPTFINADCRSVVLDDLFDAAICLYDVVGSFPEWESNQKLLENAVRYVRPGGYLAMSVMSYDFTVARAEKQLSGDQLQDALADLKASTIMQETGDVFSGAHMIVDPKQHVVYRKEIFDMGTQLPTELIVRDRRFTKDDISKMCSAVGLRVESCGHVRAGNFALADKEGSDLTRELLVIARKELV